MFLIEYGDGLFIDAESINWLKVASAKVEFTIKGQFDLFSVDSNLQESFVNNIQALNENIQNVEVKYRSLNAGD